DVTGRAVDEFEIAGDDPDHDVAHDAAEADRSEGGEGVEEHFDGDADAALEGKLQFRHRDENPGDGNFPSVEELPGFFEGGGATEENDGGDSAGGVNAFELAAVEAGFVGGVDDFVFRENGATAVACADFAKRNSVEADAETENFRAADVFHDPVLAFEIGFADQAADRVLVPLDREKIAFEEISPGGFGGFVGE